MSMYDERNEGMRLILRYLKRYKKLFLINVISVFGFALVELGIPTIIADMIDVGITNLDQAYIYKMGMVIVVISFLGVGGTVLLGYCCAKISTNITRDIRNDLFSHAQQFSPSEYNKFGTSSMITRTNNDAYQIQMFVNVILRTALLTPVMMVVSFIMTMKSSLELSWIILGTIPVIIIGVIIVAKISGPLSMNQQSSLDFLNRISRENLTGIRVIRAFNNDLHEAKRFETANTQFTNYSKRLFKLMMLTSPLFFLLMNIAALGIYFVASFMINTGNLPVGQLVAFMDYLFHAMFSVMLFCTVFMMYPRAAVSAKRILEVLECEPMIQEKEDGVVTGTGCKEVEFDHVSFTYPNSEAAVLKDVSFKVSPGQTIAFIGSTGSGKSTLINLIPRLYDCTRGKILVDGVNVKDYQLDALRSKIGFISQKAFLFNGTIAQNLRYGKSDATDEELVAACKIAQAYDFILEKPNGFNEEITEGSTNMSGGQKQRLSIARALVKKPEIFIFDDSFSALDFKTDATLRNALKSVTKEAITMVVAQRISTIMQADLIVVLNEGRVVGMGKHQELLKKCPIYYEIAASQLSEEELKHE